MTTAADLELLDELSHVPHGQRLTHVIRQLTEHEGIDNLAQVLGYTRAGALRVMLRMNRVPLRHLPVMAQYLKVDLGLLASLYLAQEADSNYAEAFFEATKPKVTDPELMIVDAARAAISENEDDLAEAELVRDMRAGRLGSDSLPDEQ